MLQGFVSPVIILAASLWTASSCFLLSAVALSQTESLYSTLIFYEAFLSRRQSSYLNFSKNHD